MKLNPNNFAPYRFVEMSMCLTQDEWDILGAAMEEFMQSDRWDEFDLSAAAGLVHEFTKGKCT